MQNLSSICFKDNCIEITRRWLYNNVTLIQHLKMYSNTNKTLGKKLLIILIVLLGSIITSVYLQCWSLPCFHAIQWLPGRAGFRKEYVASPNYAFWKKKKEDKLRYTGTATFYVFLKMSPQILVHIKYILLRICWC